MKHLPVAGVVLLLCGCAAATGGVRSDGARPVAPLSAAEQARIEDVERVGRVLYEKDIRAAVASDLLRAEAGPDVRPGFVGWVTYPNGSDYTVSFYERSGETDRVIADVAFNGSTPPRLTIDPDRSPSETEVSMIRARIAALEAGRNACSDRFNTVVVPGISPDRWEVYVLAANTNPRKVQLGGHVRVSVAKDDGRVIETFNLSNTCLALDKMPEDLPEGASPRILFATHLVSDLPVAIHPYLSLLHKMPLAIQTRRGLWIVEDGRVTLYRGRTRQSPAERGGEAPTL
jgi:hypothetical protein